MLINYPILPNGLKIIESNLLTKTIQITIDKTWKERLLSWPWKPWIKTKIESKEVPDEEQIYHDKINNVIYCHPIIAQKIKERYTDKNIYQNIPNTWDEYKNRY
jgi:hypothetical protein